jgi:hypothetical protein
VGQMARSRQVGYGDAAVHKERDPKTGRDGRWLGEIVIGGKHHRPSGDSREEVSPSSTSSGWLPQVRRCR